MPQVPAMYAIISRGEIIGHSELEHGDPPMGVAFGRFVPTARFEVFVQTVPPDVVEGDEVVIWNTLSATSPEGTAIECAVVAVFRCELGDKIAHEVKVLGIRSPPYGDLFPHHVEAYERRFPSSDAAKV